MKIFQPYTTFFVNACYAHVHPRGLKEPNQAYPSSGSAPAKLLGSIAPINTSSRYLNHSFRFTIKTVFRLEQNHHGYPNYFPM